jgi:hypothetical protein
MRISGRASRLLDFRLATWSPCRISFDGLAKPTAACRSTSQEGRAEKRGHLHAVVERPEFEQRHDAMYNWAFAVLLVIVFAHSRFNTPSNSRYSTTIGQFYFAEIAYVTCNLLLLVLMSGLVHASPEVLKLLAGGDPTQIPEGIEGISAPLVAALVMTTLLPHSPVISQIDKFLLDRFRALGNIPVEVRRLAALLRDARLQIESAAAADSARYVDAQLESPEALQAFLKANAPDEPEYIFNRVLYLGTRLKQWESHERFSGDCVQFRDDFDGIFKKLDDLVKLTSRFAAIFTLPEKGGTDAVARAHGELRKRILADCQALNREICDFLARALLHNIRTRRERDAVIRDLGFVIPEGAEAGLSATKIVTFATSVFLIFFTGLSLLGFVLNGYEVKVHRLFGIALLVAIINGVAIYCAIMPKQFWGFANIQKVGMRPVIGYFVSGVLAIIAAAAIGFVFRSLLYMNFDCSISLSLASSPWLAMSFIETVLLALLADNYAADPQRAPKWTRYAEGLAQGVAQAGIAYYIVQALGDIRGAIPPVPGCPLPAPPPWQFPCSVSFLIGVFLGATVPHWYRNRMVRPAAATATRELPAGLNPKAAGPGTT